MPVETATRVCRDDRSTAGTATPVCGDDRSTVGTATPVWGDGPSTVETGVGVRVDGPAKVGPATARPFCPPRALAATAVRLVCGFGIGLLVLLASDGTSATATPDGMAGAASARAARPTPVVEPNAPILGVNIDLGQYDAATRERHLQRLAEAGVRALRQPLRWSDLERRPGHIDFTASDALVAATARHGLHLLFSLHTSPAWARHDPPPPAHWWLCDDARVVKPELAVYAPPTDPDDFGRFAAAVAARYRHRLWAVEIWNEPNLLPNWRRAGPDPEDYARLLASAARAIREQAPEVLVVSAALAPTTDVGVCYLSDAVFLDRLAATGVLDDVDAVGIEPFGLRSGPDDPRRDREVLNFGRAEVLQERLAARHVDRPMWAMAWGWCAQEQAAAADGGPWGAHPAEDVRRWIPQAWSLARTSWPWLGPMFLWRFQPGPEDPPEQWCYALVGPDGRPSALWPTLSTLASEVVPAPVQVTTPRLAVLPVVLLIGLLGAGMLRPGSRLARGLSQRRVQGRLRLAALSDRRAVGLWLGALGLAALPWWPASLLAVPTLVLLAAARPYVALATVAAAAPFYFRLRLYAGPRPFGSVELLLAVAVGGRLLADWLAAASADVVGRGAKRERMRRRPWQAADALALVLVAWAAITLLWTSYRGVAIREWRTVILEPVIFYVLLRTADDRRAAGRSALAGAVLGGLLAAAWGLLGVALTGFGVTSQAVAAEGVIRARGPYGSPNNLALYLGRLTPVLAIALGCAKPWRWRVRMSAGLVGLALLATFSRGALLVGLPATAVVLWLAVRWRARSWRRSALGLLGAGAIALALLAPFASSQRLQGTFDLSPGSTLFVRLRLWQSSLAMLRDHPFTGVGLDNFLPHYRDTYVQRDVVQERFLSHPHNWLLDWWLRLGVVGLGIFCSLVLANARAVRRWTSRAGSLPPLVAAGLGMQAYALAHGLVDQSFFLVDLALLWWIAQAAILAPDGTLSPGAGEGDAA